MSLRTSVPRACGRPPASRARHLALCALALAAAPLAAALVDAPAPAHAFTLSDTGTGRNLAWPTRRLPVPYHINSQGSDDLSGADLDAVRASFQTWEDAPCAFITFRDAGNSTTSTAGVNDNYNNLVWVERGWPGEFGSGTIGVTTPIFTYDGEILDADIRFNGVHFTWTVSDRNALTDVATIATHEIGHFLGLDHTNIQGAVMFPSAYQGQVTRRLGPDDQRGVCYVYPIDGAQGSGCSAAADCDAGLACVTSAEGRTCTATCTVGASPDTCPAGFSCQASTDSSTGGACLAARPVGGSLCSSCRDSSQCAGGLCVGAQGGSICTSSCTSDGNCPSQYRCVPLTSGGGACWPRSDDCTNLDGPDPTGGSGGSSTPAGRGEPCARVACEGGLVCVGPSAEEAACRGSCGSTSDCTAAETCVPLQGGGGVCVPRGSGGAGAECDSEMDCARGLICLATDSGVGRCADTCSVGTRSTCPGGGTCAPLQGGGGVCIDGGALEGEPCDTEQCAGDLICVTGETFASCHSPCTLDSDCASGYDCVSLTNGSGACLPGAGGPAPEGTLAAEGEGCSASQLCAGGLLCVAQSGSVTGLCRRACDASDAACATGQRCTTLRSGAKACVPPDGSTPTSDGLGAPCTTAAVCSSGLCSRLGSDQRCSRACTPTQPGSCPPGFNCVAVGTGRGEGLCWSDALDPGSAFGASCERRSDCISGVCVQGQTGDTVCSEPCDSRGDVLGQCAPGFTCTQFGAESVCTPAGQVGQQQGEACTADAQCVSGLTCENGACALDCSPSGQKTCATGFICLARVNGRRGSVCVAQDLTPRASNGGGGLCSAAPRGAADAAPPLDWLGLGALGAWLVLGRRRAGRGQSRKTRCTNQ